MPTPVFWTEPTGKQRLWLRRYVRHNHATWTCADGWHQAMTLLEDREDEAVPSGDSWPHDDPRWPPDCDKGCGYAFTDDDRWQLFTARIYRRPDTGEEWPLRDLPPGAMYDADWMPWRKGPDGLNLVVILPNPSRHPWMVDDRASNCTMPGDDEHRCWVRHGDPRNPHGTPPLHVDKNGLTCAAGAGSIAAAGYHGFLHHGVLTDG